MSIIKNLEIIGILAAICTTIAFIPQVVKVYRSKSAKDISLGMYSIFCIGLTLWIIHGIMIKDKPLIFANIITLLLATSILIMKLFWGSKNDKNVKL
ncbi:MAG: hypothetical protein GY830_02600 [Bacteroidetes bacterium]|nr:hypothetical protein [Bacteroidota bacterium]